MSSSRRVILSGLGALAVAALLIGVAFYTGASPGGGTANAGTLSITLTDPPHVPPGVTAVYVIFSGLAVHISDAGNNSGWTTIKSAGGIELIGTTNVSQTISSAKVQSGIYNLLKFNITSAKVTFDGVNYTAFVPLATLVVPIIGGVEVTNFKPSATIIDIQPTVMHIGSTSTPEFIIRSVARAYAIPQSDVTEQLDHVGFRMSLLGQVWWRNILNQFSENLLVASASLAANSLSFTVRDTGTENTTLLLATVTPLAYSVGHRGLPQRMDGSAVFVVLSNRTLVPIRQYAGGMATIQELTRKAVLSGLLANGYDLTVNTSATFTLAGQVNMGLGILRSGTVISGEQYLITVIGGEAVASFVVQAS